MATQGVAQPSAKKRSFLLRDLFKLCRSISRALPRDKPNHHHHHHIHKAKHERKHHTNESKRHEETKPNQTPNAFNNLQVIIFNIPNAFFVFFFNNLFLTIVLNKNIGYIGNE